MRFGMDTNYVVKLCAVLRGHLQRRRYHRATHALVQTPPMRRMDGFMELVIREPKQKHCDKFTRFRVKCEHGTLDADLLRIKNKDLPKSAFMKKQKCTYTARREEAQKLRDEVQRLKSELQELQIRSLAPEDAALLDPAVQHVVAENALLTSLAKTQQLKAANVQSLLAECLGDQESHPLYTKICLTKDWNERRETLMAVRNEKLRNAYDFLMAPGRFVDPDKPHTSDYRYETSEGDICSVHLEAMHFTCVESLEQVWEALLFHYNNIEIDISERLGHTTVRDDYDAIDGSVYNTRVLSRADNCIQLESSIVTFSHLFTEEDKDFGGQVCGILALDSVDGDELYPYFPSERVRLDTSGAIMLTASRRSKKTSDGNQELDGSKEGEEQGELVVTLRRAAFLRLYHPQFPVPEATLQELQVGIGRWGDVLMKTIRSNVYSEP